MTAPGASTPGAEQACPHGHGEALGQELRALVLVALDRLDPLLARLRDAVADGPAEGAEARGCMVCTTLAAVRAERPELAGRLAAHATGLAATLREALGDRGPAAAPPESPSGSPDGQKAPARSVQRIPVVRVAAVRTPVPVPAERGQHAGREPSC